MSKHLKDMNLDELKAGYEKGKVTDEEMEQHLLGQIHNKIKSAISIYYERGANCTVSYVRTSNRSDVMEAVQALAEHEYNKLIED